MNNTNNTPKIHTCTITKIGANNGSIAGYLAQCNCGWSNRTSLTDDLSAINEIISTHVNYCKKYNK